MEAGARKILVLLDCLAPREAALQEALRLARRDAARVELYDCGLDPTLPPGWAETAESAQVYQSLLHERRCGDLERLARPLRASGIDVTTHAEEGRPLDRAIAHHLEETSPDLILFDDAVADRPAAWHVAADAALRRHAGCPVLRVDGAQRAADDAVTGQATLESLP